MRAVGVSTDNQYAVLAVMVLQFLHQTNLCFLFYGLVGRTVFTYTECIVCPDELHGQFHQGSHTNGRLHVVREYKEGTACRNHATVQSHTDAAASHCQLSHTSLEECTREVATDNVVRLLQETVSLIGVREVGRSANHVGHLLGENAQYSS